MKKFIALATIGATLSIAAPALAQVYNDTTNPVSQDGINDPDTFGDPQDDGLNGTVPADGSVNSPATTTTSPATTSPAGTDTTTTSPATSVSESSVTTEQGATVTEDGTMTDATATDGTPGLPDTGGGALSGTDL